MAFPAPVAADTTSGSVTSNSTSWTLTWPANIAAGDLVIAFVATDGNPSLSTSVGLEVWRTGASPTACELGILYKDADGTESGTFTLTLGASEQGCWRIIRIPASTWYGSGLPAGSLSGAVVNGDGLSIAAKATGASTSPDPPSGNPANWDAEDTLWIAVNAADHGNTTHTAFPTTPANYKQEDLTTNGGHSQESGGAGGAGLGVCYRQANVASQDPNAFTIDASEDWATTVIAVRPAAASGPQEVSPGAAARTLAAVAPRIDQAVTPGAFALATGAVAPRIDQAVTPAAIALALSAVAPERFDPQVVAPAALALAAAAVAPRIDQETTPAALALTLAAVAPSLQFTVNPNPLALALAPVAPAQFDTQSLIGILALSAAAVAPRIDQAVSPAAASRTLSPVAPLRIDQDLSPATLALILAAVAPRIDQAVAMGAVALAIAAVAPSSIASGGTDQSIVPAELALAAAAIAPTLTVALQVSPEAAGLVLAMLAPDQISFPQNISPVALALAAAAAAPRIDLSVAPAALNRTLAQLSPAAMHFALDLINIALDLATPPPVIEGGVATNVPGGADPWFRRLQVPGQPNVPIEAWSLYTNLVARYGLAEGRQIYEKMLHERKGPFAAGAKYDPNRHAPRPATPHIAIPKARKT